LDQEKQGFLVCTQTLAACIAGHFIPLLSIASELQSRGHSVTFLAQIQKDNEDVPRRSISKAGVAFQALGFTPLNKTELEDIVAQVSILWVLKLPYTLKMQARMWLIWTYMMEGRRLTLIQVFL
jgi:UDP:flavonoid glycosyltransferase YjiC (YdhE family)